MEIRRSQVRLISTMGFPILVRCHLYIELGPCLFDDLTMAWKIVQFDIHFPGRGGPWPWLMHIMENNDTAKKNLLFEDQYYRIFWNLSINIYSSIHIKTCCFSWHFCNECLGTIRINWNWTPENKVISFIEDRSWFLWQNTWNQVRTWNLSCIIRVR